MKKSVLNTVLARTKEHLNTGSDAIENLDEVTRLNLSLITGVSGLIGIWAFASLISAVIGIGGPLQLAQSWFSAITGM
jgi:cation transporter-like permease